MLFTPMTVTTIKVAVSRTESSQLPMQGSAESDGTGLEVARLDASDSAELLPSDHGTELLPSDHGTELLLTDLPDEVLLIVLRSGAVGALLSCATTCKQLSSLGANESLWHHICKRSWPLVATERHAPATHLCQLPPESWRQLHRCRVAGAAAGWDELLPMYD